MAGELGTFTVDLTRALDQVGARTDQFVRAFTLELAQRISRRTPVDTGFLRGSWFATVNGAGAPAGGPRTPGGASQQLEATLSATKLGDVISLDNDAHYAPYVEFGTSRMAPRAMVRTTLAEVPTIARQVAAALAGPA